MFILDTDVVTELRKAKVGKADRNVHAWAGSVAAASLFISAITVCELESGVLLKEHDDPQQARLLRTWLDEQVMPAFQGRVLPVDTTVAVRCARLHMLAPRSPRDALIAATALVHGMTVVTRKVAEFAPTGVAMLNPWDESDARAY
jgi:predicted nucleic acid-binding protein